MDWGCVHICLVHGTLHSHTDMSTKDQCVVLLLLMCTQEAKEVMRQLAEVLVYLHDNGNQSKYIHVYMYFMDILWYIEHCVHVCS